MRRLLLLLTALLLTGACNLIEDFCGSSTEAACMTDADCTTGGCGGEICQGATEEPVITTCDYRTCKDTSRYALACGCVEGQCAWR